MSWYLEGFKKYADFSGRARRKEYWYFYLFNTIASLVLALIDMMLFDAEGVGLLGGLYSLAVIIPGIAVTVRRLHDIGRSGWWLFIGLIPFVGAIALLVFLATDSVAGSNEYGPNPKETAF